MNIGAIDITTLRVFDTMMRTGHVTNTGAQLGLSQPSVSFALNKLRAQANDPLFVRTTQGMEPTPRAAKMAEAVRQVLYVLENEVFHQEEFNPRTTQRSFTLCMSDIGEIVFLPKLVEHLNHVAPLASIRTVSLSHVEVGKALAGGEVDLAVGYYPDVTQANYYQQKLYDDSFVCLMRTNHPLAGGISLSDFESSEHLVVRAEGRSHEMFDAFVEKHGLRRNVKLVIPHFMSIPHLLLDTDLIATVPQSCALSLLRLGFLKMLPLPMQPPQFELKQHWHARYHQDTANRWLRSAIYEAFSGAFTSAASSH